MLTPAVSDTKPGSFDGMDYTLAAQPPVIIRLDPRNKGLGSQLPDSLGVAFDFGELSRIYGSERPPISQGIKAALLREDCESFTDPIYMRVYVGRDHTIRKSDDHNFKAGQLEYLKAPVAMYGLLNYGRLDYTRTGSFNNLSSDELRLSHRVEFGFTMSCGLMRSPLEGGCTVKRDIAPNLYITYSFCERALPLWRELDNLYVDIATRIVKNPAILPAYKLR